MEELPGHIETDISMFPPAFVDPEARRLGLSLSYLRPTMGFAEATRARDPQLHEEEANFEVPTQETAATRFQVHEGIQRFVVKVAVKADSNRKPDASSHRWRFVSLKVSSLRGGR